MRDWLRTNKGMVAFLLLFGVFRTAVADWNPIPSGSMRPNLLEGDVVFVNRLAFDLKLPLTDVIVTQLGQPQRGDVVTFSSPKDGTRLIKRLIGVPGDRVEMRNEELIINGQKADYSPIDTGSQQIGPGSTVTALRINEKFAQTQRHIQLMPETSARRDFAATIVPPGHFMMLGDNRDDSADSRYFGFVPRKLLIGRAVRVLVSADIKGNWHPRTERFGMALN
ncbi:MAG: signal peptidase I [Pseudomonadota bacterium]